MPDISYGAGLQYDHLVMLSPEPARISCYRIDIGNRQRNIDRRTVDELKESFRKVEMISPIGVRRTPDKLHDTGFSYSLVYGAHRLVAWRELFEEAKESGDEKGMERFDQIKCIAYSAKMTDEMVMWYELTENLLKKKLDISQRKEMAGRLAKLEAGIFKQKK